jgi:oligoendopeptidase F
MTATTPIVLTRPARQFISETLDLTAWADVSPFFDALLNRPIQSANDLRQWLQDRSELDAYLSENFAWRYIRSTCNTADEQIKRALEFFITEIQPQLADVENTLDQLTIASPFLAELTTDTTQNGPAYAVMVRGMKQAIEIFREENIPLQTELQTQERQYGAIVGGMTVSILGQEMTLPQANDRLLLPDRTAREEAWRKIQERRYQDNQTLDNLFDNLVKLRHEVAKNAGFANFRDYSFAALGRFDYTPEDCFLFHESVSEAVVPMLNILATDRKQRLGISELRPWDNSVDADNLPPLKPFGTGAELLEKTIACFDKLSPVLGDYLRTMRAMGHFDLESRKAKAPGGYNYPLEEIGVPFIFMNATSSLRDLVTMVHEGGHAAHSFETRMLPLKAFRNPPMEVAELASMAMELLSMEHWDVFFENPADLRRAKIQHLEQIIETLPWIATVDKFQHWIYENPTHSHAQRRDAWTQIYDQFTDTLTDWHSLAYYKEIGWQRQLHLFEVPFYYIEYGIAQLGAIGIWRNYRQNPEAGLQGYLNALSLGYQAPIGEIYQAANVSFDFSAKHIQELIGFVWDELVFLRHEN